jgi:hypothetical protein
VRKRRKALNGRECLSYALTLVVLGVLLWAAEGLLRAAACWVGRRLGRDA